jgi:hypothetical protein
VSFRSWLWQLISALYVRSSSRALALPGARAGDQVEAQPIGVRWPGLKGAPVFVARATPRSERHTMTKRLLIAAYLRLKELLPLGDDDGPPFTGAIHYPKRFEPLARRPDRPAAWDDDDPIAAIAQRGTFSLLTERAADGYVLGAQGLDEGRYRPGFLPCGGRALLAREGDRLRTVSIESAGERAEPGDEAWPLMQKRLLVGLNTRVTLIEHLAHCHLTAANAFAIAAYETLSPAHPLMTVLHPFVIEVIRLVNHHVDGLIVSERSNVPRYSGLPLAEVNRVLAESFASFDLDWLHPIRRAEKLGTADDPAFPTVASACRAWTVYERLGRRWCQELLPDDEETRAFRARLDALLPGGAKGADLGELIARAAWISSAFHTQVGDDIRGHMLHVDIMPPCVRKDGSVPASCVEEKTNSILIAGIRRYLLKGQALPNADERGQEIWAEFLRGLEAIDDDDGVTPAAGRASAHA